jgi:hypothetical protein
MVRREYGRAEGIRLQEGYFRKAKEIYKQITVTKNGSQGQVPVLNSPRREDEWKNRLI